MSPRLEARSNTRRGNDGTAPPSPADSLRVLLLAPYPLRSAPSQRYRFEQYLDALRGERIDIDVRPLLAPEIASVLYDPGFLGAKARSVLKGAALRIQDLVRARHYDLVFVHREAYPFGYPVVERAIVARGIPLLFDFDDAIYLANTSPANRMVTPLKFAHKTEHIVAHATWTVAGNEHLAAWARSFNDRVEVIPTTIDTDLFVPRARADGPVCIGWTGSKTTIAHLRMLEPVLRDLQREYHFRLRIIGDETARIPGASVEALPWYEATELDDLAPIDIGVMPLPDEEWARGKCGLKALQCMSLGIPTVMSPVGVNSEIAEGAALLASSPAEWREALVKLIEDADLRQRIGAAGRARVVERYSVRANLPRWVGAIRAAASHGSPG